MAGPSRPPELANVRFGLVPKPRVAVPELKSRLVLLRIVLSQPRFDERSQTPGPKSGVPVYPRFLLCKSELTPYNQLGLTPYVAISP